jgi:hypothetical protein
MMVLVLLVSWMEGLPISMFLSLQQNLVGVLLEAIEDQKGNIALKNKFLGCNGCCWLLSFWLLPEQPLQETLATQGTKKPHTCPKSYV